MVRAVGKLPLPFGPNNWYLIFMSASIKDTNNSVGRPKTTGTGTQVNLRLHDPLLSHIDRWNREFAPQCKTRQDAIRKMLNEYLKHCRIVD